MEACLDRPLHIDDLCATPIEPKQTFQRQQIPERERNLLTRRAWSVASQGKVRGAI
jgi:hypothetical protein